MNWNPKELVIELAGNKNQRFLFEPLGAVLRGRWDRARVTDTSSNTQMTNMPDIPGIHVALDLKSRCLRAMDPLAWPENQETLRRANVILKGATLAQGRPWDTSVMRNLTETEVKSALWAMLGYVEGGKAIVRHGQFPTKDEVLAMPGQLKIRYGSLRIINPVTKETESPYATAEELAKLRGEGAGARIETEPVSFAALS